MDILLVDREKSIGTGFSGSCGIYGRNRGIYLHVVFADQLSSDSSSPVYHEDGNADLSDYGSRRDDHGFQC